MTDYRATDVFDREVQNVGEGWRPLVRETHESLLQIDPDYQLLQIKEKFGGLRFYFSTNIDRRAEMHDLVNKAEELTFHICEWCSGPGSTRGTGWLKTLCVECHQQFEEQRKKLMEN